MEISFQPAPIGSPQKWQLYGKVLTTPNGKRLDLSTLTSAHFTDLPVKRYWVSEFKLVAPSDEVVIRCNDRRTGLQRQRYLTLVFEVLDSLKICNPTLPIKRGTNRLFNFMFAAIALIPFGFGLNFIIVALRDGGDAFGLGLGAFFILMGAFLVWCAAPWQAPQPATPAEVKEWLRKWVGGQLDTLPPG